MSHRTAPVAVRERFSIPTRDLPAVLPRLRQGSLAEAAILSTCNRTEIYAVASDPVAGLSELAAFLGHLGHHPLEASSPHLYHAYDDAVAAHLFRVTSGLDSAILGESEVTAQVKDAYEAACQCGTTGRMLNRVFQRALHAAKEVRSATDIGQGQASVGSVVAGLVRRLFGDDLASCEVLLWGAGKAAEATTRHLMAQGVRQLWIVNRSQMKAQDLATMCQGGWLSWERAREHLAHVDIAIVCTQAPHYVIDRADLELMMARPRRRPLCLIDLAVPRNVDPSLAQQPGIALYNIDQLQTAARGALEARHGQLADCEGILLRQVDHLRQIWQRSAHQEALTC
jgi:glutamyl-tRNA reductase